jgi:hypothetical protein
MACYLPDNWSGSKDGTQLELWLGRHSPWNNEGFGPVQQVYIKRLLAGIIIFD